MTDETNNTASDHAKFFIYGGLIFHAEQIGPITAAIEQIRIAHGFAPGDQLKFDTNSRPKSVSIESCTAAKNDVIEACAAIGAKFLAYMIHHGIVNDHHEIKIQYAMNTILSVFNFKFLPEHGDTGIVVTDRLPITKDYDFLKGKFSTGLLMEDGRQARLHNVSLFASTCDGASHVSSAVDIVLGAFRYCVNQTGNTTVPKALFPKIAQMMWYHEADETRYYREYGLTMRPLEIKSPAYQTEYDAIIQHLNELIS